MQLVGHNSSNRLIHAPNIQIFKTQSKKPLAVVIYKMTTISLSPTHSIFLDKPPLACISSINTFIVYMFTGLDQMIFYLLC